MFPPTQKLVWQFRIRNSSILTLLSLLITRVCVADPRTLEFAITVGPDGPWNAMIQSVSWPERNVTMLPSFTTSNLFISTAACSGQDSSCPLPQTNLWLGRGELGTYSWMNSTPFQASSWDTSLEPLNLTGQATLISDRVTLQSLGQKDAYLDFIANTIDQDYKVNFPSSNTWYTMDTGFFSLYGASPHVNYTSVNGSSVSLNTTLAFAYDQNAIPSISYGLHIGSGSTEVPVSGSLILGGYDRSRCLTDPIVSTTETFILTDIGLGVAEGGSPFPNAQSLPINNLLQLNGTAGNKLDVYPNPGVPYLSLPSDTCNAIAERLPVIFDESLGLYLWNTTDSAFEKIVSSPSYLSFTFEAGLANTSTIYLPFALLNLTLQNPLVKRTTQYFPCSPYSPSDGTTYHLGRAFLQAALLAQNWQTGNSMLAQAPGPDVADEAVVTIASDDTSISPMVNAPSWDSTWTSKLKALPTASGNNTATDITKHSSGELSTGAIAGIVIGILALLSVIIAIAFWRRRARVAQADAKDTGPKLELVSHFPSAKTFAMADTSISEKSGIAQSPVEMDSTLIGELDGRSVHKRV